MAAVPRNLLHTDPPNYEFDPFPPALQDNLFSSPAQRLPWSGGGEISGAGAGRREAGANMHPDIRRQIEARVRAELLRLQRAGVWGAGAAVGAFLAAGAPAAEAPAAGAPVVEAAGNDPAAEADRVLNDPNPFAQAVRDAAAIGLTMADLDEIAASIAEEHPELAAAAVREATEMVDDDAWRAGIAEQAAAPGVMGYLRGLFGGGMSPSRRREMMEEYGDRYSDEDEEDDQFEDADEFGEEDDDFEEADEFEDADDFEGGVARQ
jgi:hypothetical protein